MPLDTKQMDRTTNVVTTFFAVAGTAMAEMIVTGRSMASRRPGGCRAGDRYATSCDRHGQATPPGSDRLEMRRGIQVVVSGVVENPVERAPGLDAEHLIDATEREIVAPP